MDCERSYLSGNRPGYISSRATLAFCCLQCFSLSHNGFKQDCVRGHGDLTKGCSTAFRCTLTHNQRGSLSVQFLTGDKVCESVWLQHLQVLLLSLCVAKQTSKCWTLAETCWNFKWFGAKPSCYTWLVCSIDTTLKLSVATASMKVPQTFAQSLPSRSWYLKVRQGTATAVVMIKVLQ